MADILDLGSWFILRMASADTLNVTRSLQKQGFDVWTPIERKAGRMPRTRIRYDKEFALMPSYAFANVHHVAEIRHLADLPTRNMPRFTVFQHKGGIPLIADDQLNPLRAEQSRLQAIYDKLVRKGKRGPKFDKGHLVRLSEGPFAGMEGVVEDQQGQITLVSFDGFHSPIKISSLLLLESMSGADAEIAAKAA